MRFATYNVEWFGAHVKSKAPYGSSICAQECYEIQKRWVEKVAVFVVGGLKLTHAIDYIRYMRRALLATIAALALAAPLGAQEEPPTEDREGMSLMERGARLFMEGMRREMEPALEGLGELGPMFRDFAQEMGPALRDLMGKVEDWSVYHPPEMLPNGDFIIRRKEPEPETEEDGEQIDI